MTDGAPHVAARHAGRALRDGTWLTAQRARVYGWMLLAFGAALVLGGAVTVLRPALGDPLFRPLATDFDAFWAGARLGLHGRAALAYSQAGITAAEQAGAQLTGGVWFIYLYPPVFQLFALPLGLAPYLLALPGFLLASYAALAALLRRILPPAWPWLAILAFPASSLNAMVGQNGFATAACFAAGMVWLERRPALAGMCLGLLVAKPHLALCVPVGLLAARRWRALAACGLTALSAVLLSWAVLGGDAWRGFAGAAPAMAGMLASHDIWPKLASAYAAVKILGGGPSLALAVQAASALAGLACVVAVCRRRPGQGAELATIAAAAMLCTPYLWDYDLVCLAVPLAWLAGEAGRTGWRGWERSGLAAVYALCGLVRQVSLATGLPLAPLLLAGLLALVVRRAWRPLATPAVASQAAAPEAALPA